MALTCGMFLFEVVIDKVNSLVSSRHLIIRSDFGDVFSLELKDPKTMQIIMPEPPPLPPDPPGKKGKKKPKPKKPKKGKKGAVEAPPPEPLIQAGQSVLFASSAEFLIQNMVKCPLEISLWSKEDNLTYIGSVFIPWDPVYLGYLKLITENQLPPPIVVKEEYNIFEEGQAKMMAKIGLQVKLSYLTSTLTTSFRTLSEDLNIKKVLYTGINNKTTSYMCTLKTTDENFEENSNKIPNSFVVDKPSAKVNKVNYADYKNANLGANLTFFKEGDYCCMDHADKPPISIYDAPETCPDIDRIVDYVRKIIVSCNDNMRMLTPRPTITPRIKATDMDRKCYCQSKVWPEGEFAERFKKEAQSDPCPLCIDKGQKSAARGAEFDIANIRGPCGKPECRIARDIRAYIERLVSEDNIEFDVTNIIGPCGSKDCTIAERILDFLNHQGPFSHDNTLQGLSTQCGCMETMQKALVKRNSCASICSKDCDQNGSEESSCGGPGCPFLDKTRVYNVYYFTVEHDFDKKTSDSLSSSVKLKDSRSDTSRGAATPQSNNMNDKFPHCPPTCPSVRLADQAACSKTMCSVSTGKFDYSANHSDPCVAPQCPTKEQFPLSPADSNIEIFMDDIKNPCCVKSCDIGERIKDFIEDAAINNNRRQECAKKTGDTEDPCYCDCVCTFQFTSKTTYCPICGGYQCIGDDVRDLPEFQKPHPCPVYHKLYDKKYIKTPNPWSDEEKEENKEIASAKNAKTIERAAVQSTIKLTDKEMKIKDSGAEQPKKVKPAAKKIGKFTENVADPTAQPATPVKKKKKKNQYRYPAVPKYMGWNWTAEDIPGMKPRPDWKPGAANKILVRKYRAVREGLDNIAKKKRGLLIRKKKVEARPTIRVTKRDGEFLVEMEVFKKYSKERLLYQNPYEDKPSLKYTIGKTEAQKQKLMRQRERRVRRETRRKSKLLQNTFKGRCQEICVKAYNQAIGILPHPNLNNPECPCTYKPEPESESIDSCSCSDGDTISSSDTDYDEWIIEFSPPGALYDPKAKHVPVLMDNETQYTYLDYKVKLLDKSGNPVPRFFKSHEGKTECSDLGGFWGPGKVWLEINKDGYIGPDERWIPMNFTGPDGISYSAEEGIFTDHSGDVLKLGIDGYIDKDLKWVYYARRKQPQKSKAASTVGQKTKASTPAPIQGKGDGNKSPPTDSATAGKGKTAQKKDTGTPPPKKKVAIKGNPVVMRMMLDYQKRWPEEPLIEPSSESERRKLEKYCEIMGELEMYDDLQKLKPPLKTNRASNTPNKMYAERTRPFGRDMSFSSPLSFK